MSDEPHCHLSGFVNNKNFRCWANENFLQIYHMLLLREGYGVVCDINFRDYRSVCFPER